MEKEEEKDKDEDEDVDRCASYQHMYMSCTMVEMTCNDDDLLLCVDSIFFHVSLILQLTAMN